MYSIATRKRAKQNSSNVDNWVNKRVFKSESLVLLIVFKSESLVLLIVFKSESLVLLIVFKSEPLVLLIVFKSESLVQLIVCTIAFREIQNKAATVLTKYFFNTVN